MILPPFATYSFCISSNVHPNYKSFFPTSLNVLISSISCSVVGHAFFIINNAATYLGNNYSFVALTDGFIFSACVSLFREHVDAIDNQSFLSIVLCILDSYIH